MKEIIEKQKAIIKKQKEIIEEQNDIILDDTYGTPHSTTKVLKLQSELSALEKELNNKDYCICGNPSGKGECYFEDEEKLVYLCADCGKRVKNSDNY